MRARVMSASSGRGKTWRSTTGTPEVAMVAMGDVAFTTISYAEHL